MEPITIDPPWQFETPAPRGRENYAARRVFASEVFGILVAAGSSTASDKVDEALYQLKIESHPNPLEPGHD
jgi:hypothetical protein